MCFETEIGPFENVNQTYCFNKCEEYPWKCYYVALYDTRDDCDPDEDCTTCIFYEECTDYIDLEGGTLYQHDSMCGNSIFEIRQRFVMFELRSKRKRIRFDVNQIIGGIIPRRVSNSNDFFEFLGSLSDHEKDFSV